MNLAGIVYISYMLTGTILLLNVFIMIVMFEFEEVRNDKECQSNDYEAIDHVKLKVILYTL